jgi:hypothetical protein
LVAQFVICEEPLRHQRLDRQVQRHSATGDVSGSDTRSDFVDVFTVPEVAQSVIDPALNTWIVASEWQSQRHSLVFPPAFPE